MVGLFDNNLSAPRIKPSRLLSEQEIKANPVFSSARNAQLFPVDALTGELGLFANPDGSFSSERSATRPFQGGFVNFPLLVRGQSSEAAQRILRGEGTPQDEDIAFARFIERTMMMGLPAPFFNSMEEAIFAAQMRSQNKQVP